MKVLVCDPISDNAIELLQSKLEVEVKGDRKVEDLIEDFDAVIVRSATKITSDTIEKAKRLKVIGRAGVGLDTIDVEAAKKKKIKVINTPRATSRSVAELVIAMIFALSRDVVNATMSVKDGKWEKKRFEGREVKDKTLGIIGLGGIGCDVAELAIGIGMNVIATRAHLEMGCQIEGVKMVQLEELLSSADIISINVPLNDATRGMIGKKEMERMKEDAIVINCARGGIVDEKALYEALKSGKLSGAGIDVYELEPPKNSPLLTLNNVILTPHIGGQTIEGQERCGMEIAIKVMEALGAGA
jgi:D-3-phosphoglycerate dehydrogenase